MNIEETVAPRSDQLNFDDVASSKVVVTVAEVRKGTTEQPVEVHLAEYPGRPYKPSKSMRRVLLAAWGKDTTTYTGRTIGLYGDDEVKFGGQTVGGIKIGALSDIDREMQIPLTVAKGKRAKHAVKPLNTAVTAGVNTTTGEITEPTEHASRS